MTLQGKNLGETRGDDWDGKVSGSLMDWLPLKAAIEGKLVPWFLTDLGKYNKLHKCLDFQK